MTEFVRMQDYEGMMLRVWKVKDGVKNMTEEQIDMINVKVLLCLLKNAKRELKKLEAENEN
jgi:hypothetical protein